MDTITNHQDLQTKWEAEQLELKSLIVETDDHEWNLSSLKRVGGVDISFVKGDDVNAVASLVVCAYPSLEVIYEATVPIQLTIPYIPGFLAFREYPHLAELIQACPPDRMPQIIMADGNGILHPRGFGLACHLGVKLDIPAIGVSKNLFVMDGLDRDDVKKKAQAAFASGEVMMHLLGNSGRTWGAAVRSTSASTDPVFVSLGHRTSLDTSIQLVRQCCKYRIPEPVRQADLRSRDYIRVNY